MREKIIDALNQVLLENGHARHPFNDSTDILRETQIDSLGLALALVKLEESTGKDPFKSGFVSFRTVGEMVRLYDEA